MKPIRIVIHHSADALKEPQFDKINIFHRQKFGMKSSLGFWGGYNFLLEKSGDIKQYRAVGEETAAQKGYNKDSLSICLAGDFNREMPTHAQIASLKSFLTQKTALYGIPIIQILPHRQLSNASTDCYGKNLSDDWARNLLSENESISILKKMIEIYQKLILLFRRK